MDIRFSFTDEMHELMKVFEPYEDGNHLVENAPKEAIEAREKFCELFKIEYEKSSNIDLL